MPFVDEKISPDFGVPGQTIEQTLSQSFDPFSGLDIDTSTFQNTKNGFLISNQDGRIPLGMFYFEEDNILKNNFPPKISNTSFRQVPKPNLIRNGSCQFIEAITTENIFYRDIQNRIVFPGQNPRYDGWGYCAFDGVGVRHRFDSIYDNRGSFPEDMPGGQNFIDSFEQSGNFDPTLDNQGATGAAGWQPYLYLLQKALCWITYNPQENPNRANDFCYALAFLFAEHDGVTFSGGGNDFLGTDGVTYNVDARFPLIGRTGPGLTAVSADDVITGKQVYFPNIAKWIQTPEANSYGRCLDFTAVDFVNGRVDELGPSGNGIWGFTYNTGVHWENAFSWSDPLDINDDWDEYGHTNYKTNANEVAGHQYRTLNQVTNIYVGGNSVEAEERINPYTTMEIKFKMKTMEEGYDGSNPPQIELGVVDGDFYTGDPRRWERRVGSDQLQFNKNHHYWPHGDFNTLRYEANDNPPGNLNNRYSNFGSMGRFQNTELNTWQTFTYKFVLGDVFRYTTPPSLLRRLSMIVQAAGDFKGRVLLDDFECYESGDFIPDVDVRKKISVGNYGKADLTKYYDKDLQPEEYADTTGPLEAQFYFYPQYPTTNVFGQTRTPVYQDFKLGKFYIYDIDWGDGTPREFNNEPTQIDEETALYHTYQTNGIFEITGTMLRMKTDENGELLGIIHNKKFTLRIMINEGFGEDFQFFGSEGFSFIPYKNTTPIIGGISNQSLYYKSLKRQLGFVSDDIKTNVEFKYDGDKLRTEIALLKMENQNDADLDILPNYMIPRYGQGLGLGNYMLQPSVQGDAGFPDENLIEWNYGDLLINTENIPAGIIQIFSMAGEGFVTFDETSGTWDTINAQYDTLRDGVDYYFVIKVGDPPVGWSLLNDLLPVVEDVVIYNGISPIKEELGKSIGDCNVTCIKYYNEPKNLSDLLGFEQQDLGQIGLPNHPRYWKNIIPKNYSVFNRDGLVRINDNELDYVIPSAEQDWLDNYYYPVLPKYNNDGRFREVDSVEDYPSEKKPFPQNGPITDENESSENLIFSITSEAIESNVLLDRAGNGNLGLTIGDYRVRFDNRNSKPKKVTTYDKLKKAIIDGAF